MQHLRTMGAFLSCAATHEGKILDPKKPELTQLLGRDLSFLHRLLQNARAKTQDLNNFQEKDVLRRLHFADIDVIWKTFLAVPQTDEEFEANEENMNFLNLFMVMCMCAHASRALRSAMIFNVFVYEISPFLPDDPNDKDPRVDITRTEVIALIKRLALGLVQLTSYQMPHGDEIDDLSTALLTEHDAHLDLRIGIREWNHFCRHDRIVQQLFNICDSLGKAGIRDMGTMPSWRPERPTKLVGSVPSPNRKKRSTKRRAKSRNEKRPATYEQLLPFSATRKGGTTNLRRALPEHLIRPARKQRESLPPEGMPKGAEDLLVTAGPHQRSTKMTKSNQELGKEGLMSGALGVFRDTAQGRKVTVEELVRNLSLSMDVSIDALTSLFADSGKYTNDYVVEKDFIRIMGQFDFHGSRFAKEIVARLEIQLADVKKQAADAIAEAQREKTNAHKFRRRCAELEQTLAHCQEEMQLLVKTREQTAQEQEDLAEQEMGKRIDIVKAELKKVISMSVGAAKEQANLSLKVLTADTKREERLNNLVHSTEEGGNEEDNELVRNQLLWSQEKTDNQLQKREHEATMFLSQAVNQTRIAKEKLEVVEEEVKTFVSEIRGLDVRLKEVSLRDKSDNDVEKIIMQLNERRRAVEKDELVRREKATVLQAEYKAKHHDEAVLQDIIKLINEARSAKWSCIRESDERSTIVDMVVRRYLSWVGKACSQDLSRNNAMPRIPTIIILVPVPERRKLLLSIPKADLQYEWFGDTASSMMEKIDPFTGRTLQVKSDGNMSLHFLCAYDFSPVGNGYLIPNGREFASQIMPILQLSIILLKEVLNSGARMYNLPLPVHSWDPTTVKEMFSIMQMVFVNEEKPMEEQKRIEDLTEIVKSTHDFKQKSADEEARFIRKLTTAGVSNSLWDLDDQLELMDPEGTHIGLRRLKGIEGTEAWVKDENIKQWQLRSAVQLASIGRSGTAKENLKEIQLVHNSGSEMGKRPSKDKGENSDDDDSVYSEKNDEFDEMGSSALPTIISSQVGATRRRISVSKKLGDGLQLSNKIMHDHAAFVSGSVDAPKSREDEEIAQRKRRASLALDLAI